jgi:hypothetical protein
MVAAAGKPPRGSDVPAATRERAQDHPREAVDNCNSVVLVGDTAAGSSLNPHRWEAQREERTGAMTNRHAILE